MVVVEPRGTGMALFTLRAAEEVRAAQFGMAEGELDAEMVAIAKTIIAQRTGSFDPSFDASESSSQFRDATLAMDCDLGVYGGMNENFVLVAGRSRWQADGV